MAYKVGGIKGVNKAIESKNICTISLDSAIQVSGKVVNVIDDLLYLQLSGPVQLSYKNEEIEGHGR